MFLQNKKASKILNRILWCHQIKKVNDRDIIWYANLAHFSMVLPAELHMLECCNLSNFKESGFVNNDGFRPGAKYSQKSSSWSNNKNFKRELWSYLQIKIATFLVWIWVFNLNFKVNVLNFDRFWSSLFFSRKYIHVHFCRICNDIAIFFNWWYHTFRLIFSILMRAISLKNELKFVYYLLSLIYF